MKKVFVDIYLAYNLGDDLFLDILANKYKEVEFTVNYVGRKYDDFISKYKNVKRRKYSFMDKLLQKSNVKDTLNNYEVIAKNHDAMIFIGGSIFREESYHKDLYAERIKMVTAFNNINKPVFVLGSNFGPYHSETFLQEYKLFFSKCKDVCFRDKYSYELFRDMKNVRYAPDIVFNYNVRIYKRHNGIKRVGFSIIDLDHKAGLEKYKEDYIDSNVKAIELLARKGYQCSLMSFCEIEGDLNTIKDILSRLNDNIKSNVSVFNYKGSINEALKVIDRFDLFIAARFHGCILSKLLGVPLLPVIYSAKTKNMLEDLGFQETLIEMNNLHMLYDEKILDSVIRSQIKSHDIGNLAEHQFDKLSGFLRK